MKFLGGLNKKVLSIDFGASEIKIVEGQASKKGLNILKAFSASLPKDVYRDGEIINREMLMELIKEALEENKVSTKRVYGTINSSKIITREITLPKVDEDQVASIIQYQLEDFLPVDPEDYVVQYLIIDTIFEDKVEKFNIFLIAIPKTIVLSHMELLKETNLRPKVLDFQGNAIGKLMNSNNKINDIYDISDKVIASIDMGYDNSKLTIIKNGKIELTRILDTGAKELYENIKSVFDYTFEECEEKVKDISNINQINEEFNDYSRLVNITKSTMASLTENIENLIRYYRSRQLGNNVDLMVLQGGLSKIRGLDELFYGQLKITTISLEELDMLNWYGDLKKYSNAIGALIRIGEV